MGFVPGQRHPGLPCSEPDWWRKAGKQVDVEGFVVQVDVDPVPTVGELEADSAQFWRESWCEDDAFTTRFRVKPFEVRSR